MTTRTLATLVALLSAVFVAATASAASAPSHASLVIRHQMRGCHTWSVNGGPFRRSQTVSLRTGGSITVTNNDIMPHRLVKTSGPAVRMLHPRMNRMSATSRVVFPRKGHYRFTTKPGEDYPGMEMKTSGEDYVLHLTVHVS